ncbi:MAG: zinc-ribbon domain-containing protein [Hyphomicrobiales bacterium]|nr:zinc-ribbon domain-containing protein [Hyphomicrobiales bacterium]
MSTIIQCPHCGAKYRLKFAIADGKLVRCPTCSQVWQFQAPEPEPEAFPDFEAVESGPSYGSAPSDEPAAPPSHEPRYASAQAPEPTRSERFDDAAAALRTAGLYGAQSDAAPETAGSSVAGYDDSLGQGVRDEAATAADWTAELAGAIKRAGYEEGRYDQNTGHEFETERDPALAYSNGAAASYRDDTVQSDDDEWSSLRDGDGAAQPAFMGEEEQRLAAERLSAFWRGEKAAASFDDEVLGADRDRMPVAQPEEEERRPRASLAAAAAWGAYASVVGAVLFSVVAFRDSVVEALPGAAQYYESAGLEVRGARLEFQEVRYVWSKRDERPVLEVKGFVANLSGSTQRIPGMNITVRDDKDAEIAKTTARISEQPLEPGGRAEFTLEFLSPPDTVSGVELEFDKS